MEILLSVNLLNSFLFDFEILNQINSVKMIVFVVFSSLTISFNKINWIMLSGNPSAINLLEKYIEIGIEMDELSNYI